MFFYRKGRKGVAEEYLIFVLPQRAQRSRRGRRGLILSLLIKLYHNKKFNFTTREIRIVVDDPLL